MIQKYDIVDTISDIYCTDGFLYVGSRGTVVEIYELPEGTLEYHVEFCYPSGQFKALVILKDHHLLKVTK